MRESRRGVIRADDVIADLRHTKRIVERVAEAFVASSVVDYASQSPRRERRVDRDGCRHSEDCLSERTLSQLAENGSLIASSPPGVVITGGV